MISYKHLSIHDLKTNTNKREASIVSFRFLHNKYYRVSPSIIN